MRKKTSLAGLLILAASTCLHAQVNSLAVNKHALIFSTVKGTDSRPDTIILSGKAELMKIGIHIGGEQP